MVTLVQNETADLMRLSDPW